MRKSCSEDRFFENSGDQIEDDVLCVLPTDIHTDRLPAHNPYVGTFHRGYKISNSDTPTFDLKPFRVPAKNPYVGSFNHSAADPFMLAEHMRAASLSTSSYGCNSSASSNSGSVDEDEQGSEFQRSQAATPLSSSLRNSGSAKKLASPMLSFKPTSPVLASWKRKRDDLLINLERPPSSDKGPSSNPPDLSLADDQVTASILSAQALNSGGRGFANMRRSGSEDEIMNFVHGGRGPASQGAGRVGSGQGGNGTKGAKGSKWPGQKNRSFADLTELMGQSGIKTPELCGLQAIVPKQSGVRILDKVGEGSFAKVVVALNKRNSQQGQWKDHNVKRRIWVTPSEGEKLVLKCMKKEEHAGGSESLERELEIHSSIHHPNVPRCYGYYEDPTNVMMILEYIDGSELKGTLNTRRMLPEPEAKLIIVQVLRALAYMHDKEFVHRDVSPRNVLVNEESKRAWLIDLGLAIDLKSSNKPPAVGTLGYTSPESMRGELVGTAADIWAVGCILYEMLFGFSPFLPHEILGPTEVPFPDPSWGMESSPEVRDIIVKMLCKDAKKRISSREALAHPWSEACVAEVDEIVKVQGVPQLPSTPKRLPSDASQQESPPNTCLAVDLISPPHLKSTVGDHTNYVARVRRLEMSDSS